MLCSGSRSDPSGTPSVPDFSTQAAHRINDGASGEPGAIHQAALCCRWGDPNSGGKSCVLILLNLPVEVDDGKLDNLIISISNTTAPTDSVSMHIPILCYHAHILPSVEYADNGHAALASDLEMIQAAGRRIVPLEHVVDWVRGERDNKEMERTVALSFDDGTRLDFEPVEHPELGALPGFLPLLDEFAARYPTTQPTVHATSFVIASPRAREQADRELLFRRGWLDDGWWARAERSGRISIGNHSWDHNMAVAEEAPVELRDRFDNIDTFKLAEHEIARASQWLSGRLGQRPSLFGYPYGQSNSYLVDEYLPTRGRELGLRAAFTTDGRVVERGDDCWNLPRLVHGHHWRKPSELGEILGIS